MGLVINAMSILPAALQGNQTAQSLRDFSCTEARWKGKTFHSKSVLNSFKVQMLFICRGTGKIFLFSSFSKLIIEEEKKSLGKVQFC